MVDRPELLLIRGISLAIGSIEGGEAIGYQGLQAGCFTESSHTPFASRAYRDIHPQET